MGSGIHWTNKILADKEREKLYCLPKDTILNTENYVYFINEFLNNNPYAKKTAEGYSIGLIQIISLIEAFPCTENVPAK